MKETLMDTILFILGVWLVVGSILGFGAGGSTAFKEGACKYNSIAKITSVGYIVGCEAFKPRTWFE